MARIRTIKPEFWTDSFMVQLPPIARLFYIALWTAADDYGFIRDEPDRLAMELFPRENPLVVDDWLQFFCASGRIETFIAGDGTVYHKINSWEKHQRIDKPTKSKIAREDSRKVAIPLSVRRRVAEKYGCAPGENIEALCYYCGVAGRVHWHKLSDGRPSQWVTFPGLELDHLIPEDYGGAAEEENIVLSCRMCNRSKGTKHWLIKLSEANLDNNVGFLARIREDSRGFGIGKERKGRERKGREGNVAPANADAPPETPETKIRKTKNKTDTPKREIEKLSVPVWLNDLWPLWEQARRQIHKPLTPVAVKGQLESLELWAEKYGQDAARHTLQMSINSGWQGIFERHAQEYALKNSSTNSSLLSRADEKLARNAARIASALAGTVGNT